EHDLLETLLLREVGGQRLVDELVEPVDALARRLAPVPRERPAAIAGRDVVDELLLRLVDRLAERLVDDAALLVGLLRRAGVRAVEVRAPVGLEPQLLHRRAGAGDGGRPQRLAAALDRRAGEAGDVDDRQPLGLHVPQRAPGRPVGVLAGRAEHAVDPLVLRVVVPDVAVRVRHLALDDAAALLSAAARHRRRAEVQRAVAARRGAQRGGLERRAEPGLVA